MLIENTFKLDIPAERAWAALNNPETVAPCFPGAKLEAYSDDSFNGTVKVKLGPIALTYKGTGRYVERDESARRVVIEATGRDARGSGTASATVTGTLTALDDDSTTVSMVTDLAVTGKPAQFGRGVISDVSEKLIGQFAECLSERLVDDSRRAEPATTAVAANTQADDTIEAVDLLDLSGPAVARAAPIGLAVLLIGTVLLLVRRSTRTKRPVV